jgi:hypothetical protein
MHNLHILLLTAALVAGCSTVPALAHAPVAKRFTAQQKLAPDVAGKWVMTIVIGNRTFEDHVNLVRGADGRLTGDLTVVGLWSAPLENVEAKGDQLAFELIAPEKDKFRVRYQGTVSADGRGFTGLATLPEENGQTMGAFKAVKS